MFIEKQSPSRRTALDAAPTIDVSVCGTPNKWVVAVKGAGWRQLYVCENEQLAQRWEALLRAPIKPLVRAPPRPVRWRR